MSERGNITIDDRQVRQATKYIIGTCIMFYCTVVSLICYIILHAVIEDPEDSYVRASQIFMMIFQNFYGIGNVVLYGYLYPTYMQKIKQIIRLSNRNSRISPN